ncbi:MAG: TCP-1/cpn60 chaperonin family protein [Thaumarchaeota archaeon]|nr:TCP-1/cpn60 chaperonin family protein [Nitrososphaerota archaeon]MCL5317362.1 TCP-1/cpn60 chaperonin family protein [Nitrososphaerota archaeon]
MKSVISPNFGRIGGRDAWRTNLHLAALAANKVSGTLGPKGGYVMLSYNRGPENVVKVTKDSVEIMEELGIEYPGIKIISEAVKMQRIEVGDGASSFVLLLTGLLQGAEQLIAKGVHPSIVISGYNEAAEESLRILSRAARRVEDDGELFERLLKNVDCGRGLMGSDLCKSIAEASVLAVKDGKLDKKRVRIVKKIGGGTGDSKLIRGIIVKKGKTHPSMPDSVEKPRIALISGNIGLKRLEVKMKGEGLFPITLDVDDPGKMKAFKEEEARVNLEILERIKRSGANVLLCRQTISDEINGGLAHAGIFALMSLDQEDLDAVSAATGARIVGDIKDLDLDALGSAANLMVDKIEPEKITILSGCDGATLLLRGNTSQILDELEKMVRNSVTVLKETLNDKRLVIGGGAVEMMMSQELRQHSLKFKGKEQLAIQYFADSLESIPQCLARNNGLNPLDAIIQLRSNHAKGFTSFGISEHGCDDMARAAVEDSVRVKSSVIQRAYDVAVLMLRIDDLISAKAIPKFHKQ